MRSVFATTNSDKTFLSEIFGTSDRTYDKVSAQKTSSIKFKEWSTRTQKVALNGYSLPTFCPKNVNHIVVLVENLFKMNRSIFAQCHLKNINWCTRLGKIEFKTLYQKGTFLVFGEKAVGRKVTAKFCGQIVAVNCSVD